MRTFLKFTPKSPLHGPDEKPGRGAAPARRREKGRHGTGGKAKAKEGGGKGGQGHPLWDSKFVAKMKFRNTLPLVPVDSRFLQYPFPQSRFSAYKPTTLERDHQRLLLLGEAGMATTVSLVDPMRYTHPDDRVSYVAGADDDDIRALVEAAKARSLDTELDPKDEVLIELSASSLVAKEEDVIGDATFLRKGQYMGGESLSARAGAKNSGGTDRLHGRSSSAYQVRVLSVDEQKDAVEATFAAAASGTPTHPRIPGMKAKRVCAVLPSATLTDPTVVSFAQRPAADTAGAVIRGADHHGDAYVMYLLPNKRRKRLADTDVAAASSAPASDNDDAGAADDDDSRVSYTWVREFNYDVRHPNSYYLWAMDGDVVEYSPVDSVLSLSKRRPVGTADRQLVRPATITAPLRPSPA